MIWYFLFFLRGTTKPPVLDQKHPLRAAFTRYGYNAARHPVVTLLISVAAATILAYPFPFLYTNNFTNGSSNLPHHVWTAAQPYEGKAEAKVDVVMRSIWVHGSYMKALEPKILLGALDIQDHLLGSTRNFDPRRAGEVAHMVDSDADFGTEVRDTFHAINGLTNSSWFFHSPLQYWAGAREAIMADKDIVNTVNERARQSTSVNVTLRHSIVFSGKRFEDHRLVGADALVITLIHMLDSPVAKQWERKAAELASDDDGRWKLYPSDGRSVASTLYEFRFQPLSLQDDLFLGFAYAVACLYFLLTLSKLRALKSRLGLIVAVVTQILVSIISSFTVCAVLKIDLSKIPREAYPLVILTVGLENIFRYINAVIITPPTNSTATRMGEALGTTCHVALAGVLQNLGVLWILSGFVSPQIKAFCTFAAIALTFDFFYMITFFTGVLSIELRRTELSDALQRVSTRNRRSYVPSLDNKRTWTDALLQGDAPFSTRIAGTIVMVGFVLVAQWHFFDNESLGKTASRFVHMWSSRPPPRYSPAVNTLSVDINQARSPTAWLKLQDHETAHEVIKIIKPNASSYLARVYDPLIFVLDGSDRTRTTMGVRRFLPAAYDFIRHQSTPFFYSVLLCMAIVTLLMNYLLWDELSEMSEDEDEDRPEDTQLIVIKSLPVGHLLDIALLEGSPAGIIVSVGIDRVVRVWDIRKGINSCVLSNPDSEYNPFPVLSMAIDNNSVFLALLSADKRIYIWNLPDKKWERVIDVDVGTRKPLAFFFGFHKTDFVDPLIFVRPNGMLTELHIESDTQGKEDMAICKSPLVCVQQHFEKSQTTSLPLPRIVTASRKGCIHIATQMDGTWVSKGVDLPYLGSSQESISVLSLPNISSFLVVRHKEVDLIDVNTHKVIHTFSTNQVKRDTLRCFHSARRRPQCGNVGLASLALAYTDEITGHCVLQTYFPYRENDTLCFREPWAPGSKTCCLWNDAVETRHIIENPGKWESLQVGYLVGLRKITKSNGEDKSQETTNIRRRGVTIPQKRSRPSTIKDQWEVWSISARGERFTLPMCDEASGQQLLVDTPGPIVRVGKRSVAIGMGNVIKIITVGHERFNGQDDSDDDTAFVGMKASQSRRKKFNSTRKRM